MNTLCSLAFGVPIVAASWATDLQAQGGARTAATGRDAGATGSDDEHHG
jgi:hypothetical protein